MSLGDTYQATIQREPALVGYWRLNDSSTTLLDLGNRFNLNGFYNGTVASSSGMIQGDSAAGSHVFNVTGANASVADQPALRLVGDITLEAWIGIGAATPASGPIVAKMNSAGTVPAPYELSLASGQISLAMGNGTTSTAVTGTTAPPYTAPSHIVATCFRGAMTAYLNGVVVGTANLGAQSILDGAQPLTIGGFGSVVGVNALIGEVAIYSGALSARRVLRHFVIGQQVLSDPAHYTLVDAPVWSI